MEDTNKLAPRTSESTGRSEVGPRRDWPDILLEAAFAWTVTLAAVVLIAMAAWVQFPFNVVFGAMVVPVICAEISVVKSFIEGIRRK
jgi:hypothetical protein